MARAGICALLVTSESGVDLRSVAGPGGHARAMNDLSRPYEERRFVAQPPFWGSKVASITTPAYRSIPHMYWIAPLVAIAVVTAGLAGTAGGVAACGRGWLELPAGTLMYGFQAAALALLFGGVYLWTRWSRHQEIVVSVTGDVLTVSTRPRDVYSFHDAKLGTWGEAGSMTMGIALHLRCGERHFILGGRDRRVAADVRLDAPDVGYGLRVDVDAWLPEAEFEEVLTMVSRRSGLDIRKPSADESVRCLLFSNPLLVQTIKGVRKQQKFMRSAYRPRLAIDVGAEVIRVLDAENNTVIASVSPSRVSASPVTYRPLSRHWVPSVGSVISDAASNYWSMTPAVRLSIPGMPPLNIGCRDSDMGLDYRFLWSGDVPAEDSRADYIASGADWQLLVEKFGLTQYLAKGATT